MQEWGRLLWIYGPQQLRFTAGRWFDLNDWLAGSRSSLTSPAALPSPSCKDYVDEGVPHLHAPHSGGGRWSFPAFFVLFSPFLHLFFKSASQLIHTELQVKRACFDLTSSLYRWADYWSCLRCARVLVPKDIMSSYNRGQAATAGWSCCCLFKTRVWVQEMLCDAERLCTATAEGIVRILGSKEVLVLQLDYFKCLYDLCFCVHSSYLPSFPGQNTI